MADLARNAMRRAGRDLRGVVWTAAMLAPNLFQFEDHLAYLNSLKASFPGCKRPLSGSQLARALGYDSPRIVAMVLKGARLPSREMTERIGRRLRFSETERRYFECLVLLARSRRNELPVEALLRELGHLRGRRFRLKSISTADFSLISEWHHFPIEQLVGSPAFKEDPKWIVKRLRGKISPSVAGSALKRLQSAGLIARDAGTGKLRFADFQHATSSNDVPSVALREHHRQMMARAAEALEEQSVSEREFRSLSLLISPSDLPPAKEMIRKFFREFNERFSSESSDDVYQLSLQFFSHTIPEDPS